MKQSYKKAFGWYEKAAEQGHRLAQYNANVMYYNGTGVDQNYEKAAAWYKKAAGHGEHEHASFIWVRCTIGVRV